MRIKLNNKRYKIKTAASLTVREYIKLSLKDTYSIIDYLSVVTGLKFAEISKIKITDKDIRRIAAYIGTVTNGDTFFEASNIKMQYYFNEKLYDLKTGDCETLGVRIAMEQKAKTTDNVLELSLFLFAVILSGDYDSEVTENIYNNLLNTNHIDTFMIAGFFLQKFQHGINSVQKSSTIKLKTLVVSMLKRLTRSKTGA